MLKRLLIITMITFIMMLFVLGNAFNVQTANASTGELLYVLDRDHNDPVSVVLGGSNCGTEIDYGTFLYSLLITPERYAELQAIYAEGRSVELRYRVEGFIETWGEATADLSYVDVANYGTWDLREYESLNGQTEVNVREERSYYLPRSFIDLMDVGEHILVFGQATGTAYSNGCDPIDQATVWLEIRGPLVGSPAAPALFVVD